MQVTEQEADQMFKEGKLRKETENFGHSLILQAIPWTVLNDKRVFQKFIGQASLYRVDTVLEAILQFNSFMNVFIVRFKLIEGYGIRLQAIIREFTNIRQLIELGPEN